MRRVGTRAALLLAVVAGGRASAGVPAVAPAVGVTDAAPSIPARFAIIVGVNNSVTRDPPLRYADDDAAGYLELFRALGARTYLLSRFDEGTRRLHQQAAAEARDPRRADLAQMVEQVAADVALARARHLPTVVYFVYAGHGNVDNGRGYLALEDARLYGADLEQLIVDRIGAAETHFIIDACYSVFLALSRGPGGERREAHGFSTLGGLGARPGVGLLLSTSSARESHEWSEFQGGVFSHEVRSGLLGAADANGDGQVTYREIAAFVERANAPIPNEKFRPDVYAKEPASAPPLLDLRPALGRRLELTGAQPGHYFIEDTRGVRLADFNNAPGHALHVIRPAGATLFLRKIADAPEAEMEYVMDASPAVVRLEDLQARPSTAQPRGGANESFRLLFSLPFSQQVVDAFIVRSPAIVEEPAPDAPAARSLRRPIGIGLVAAGAAAAVGGTWALASAVEARPAANASQQDIYRANQTIDDRNALARMLYGAAGVALTAGLAVLLWPRFARSEPPLGVSVMPREDGGAEVGWAGRF